jgi:hypothetical protein
LYSVGDYIVYDNAGIRADLTEINYTGAIVVRVTEVTKYYSIAEAVGVVKYATATVRIYHNDDKVRLATSEEIRIAKNTKIPKRKKVKEIEDDG